jgi:DNA-binding transcriptional regulator YdaS (Cro superfamily)
MNLRDYLTKNKISMSKFAKDLDVSVSTISLLINGKRRPSAELALAIDKITNGKVSRDEVMYPELYIKKVSRSIPEYDFLP